MYFFLHSRFVSDNHYLFSFVWCTSLIAFSIEFNEIYFINSILKWSYWGLLEKKFFFKKSTFFNTQKQGAFIATLKYPLLICDLKIGDILHFPSLNINYKSLNKSFKFGYLKIIISYTSKTYFLKKFWYFEFFIKL